MINRFIFNGGNNVSSLDIYEKFKVILGAYFDAEQRSGFLEYSVIMPICNIAYSSVKHKHNSIPYSKNFLILSEKQDIQHCRKCLFSVMLKNKSWIISQLFYHAIRTCLTSIIGFSLKKLKASFLIFIFRVGNGIFNLFF